MIFNINLTNQKEWLKFAEIEQAITDKPSIEKEYSEFIDHRHDQAILSLLYLKKPTNIKIIEHQNTSKSFCLHRRRHIEYDGSD